MTLLRRAGELLLLAGIIFLLILVAFSDRITLPPLLQVMGRLHPVFLHFPIALLLIYLISFWIPSSSSAWGWFRAIGFIAVLSAVLTAIMGMMLSLQGSYEGVTFQRHKWGGVAIAILSVVIYYGQPYIFRNATLGRALSFSSACLILITGHWGGKLTHGEDYLLEPYERIAAKVSPAEAVAFDHIILPIFTAKCAGCHNAGSSKGGLSLVDSNGVIAGGKTGPFLLARNAAKSLFLQRIALPATDKKHMAPSSKPQVTDEELLLLREWVKAGAPMNKKVIDLPETDTFRLLAMKTLSPSGGSHAIAYDFPAADEKTVKSLDNNYRMVSELGANSPALRVLFFGAKAYTPAALSDLLKIKDQVVELSLSRMPVKNEELSVVGQMKNLESLNLNYTDIGDDGMQRLKTLNHLKEITISGTKITATGIRDLAALPALRSVFAWNLPVDSQAVAAIKNGHAKLKIETGYKDDGSELLPLNPPVAAHPTGVYAGEMSVAITHPMKSVQIRYTIDGTEPDSVKSAIYKAPLIIDSFTIVKARAFKPGWYGSSTMRAAYFMQGPNPDSILVQAKDNSIVAKAKLFIDGQTGDDNIGTAKWIRLEKPSTIFMYFDSAVDVREMRGNFYVKNDGEIWLPKSMKLWGGMEPGKMKLLNTWSSAKPKNSHLNEVLQPAISFPRSKVRCLKLTIDPWEVKKSNISSYVSELVLR